MKLQRVHLVIGIISTVIFLFTGLYMLLNFPDLYQGDQAVRIAFRANHVYILSAGLLNMGLGLYLQLQETRWKRTLQMIGSILLLAAPLFLTVAFFFEPLRDYARRPLTVTSIFFLFAGVILHFVASYRTKSGL